MVVRLIAPILEIECHLESSRDMFFAEEELSVFQFAFTIPLKFSGLVMAKVAQGYAILGQFVAKSIIGEMVQFHPRTGDATSMAITCGTCISNEPLLVVVPVKTILEVILVTVKAKFPCSLVRSFSWLHNVTPLKSLVGILHRMEHRHKRRVRQIRQTRQTLPNLPNFPYREQG